MSFMPMGVFELFNLIRKKNGLKIKNPPKPRFFGSDGKKNKWGSAPYPASICEAPPSAP